MHSVQGGLQSLVPQAYLWMFYTLPQLFYGWEQGLGKKLALYTPQRNRNLFRIGDSSRRGIRLVSVLQYYSLCTLWKFQGREVNLIGVGNPCAPHPLNKSLSQLECWVPTQLLYFEPLTKCKFSNIHSNLRYIQHPICTTLVQPTSIDCRLFFDQYVKSTCVHLYGA